MTRSGVEPDAGSIPAASTIRLAPAALAYSGQASLQVPSLSDGALVYHVYILRCADESLYVGYSACVEVRVKAHNAGEAARFTRRRRPVKLVYREPHASRLEAIRRERQIKRWSRAKKEALICGDLELLRALSKRRS